MKAIQYRANSARRSTLRRMFGAMLFLVGAVLPSIAPIWSDRLLADVENWSVRTASDENALWFSVAHGNGVFVAVGLNGKVMSSGDGITWTSRTTPPKGAGPESDWTSVTYGNGKFVAVSSCYQMTAWQTLCNNRVARVMTSPDGITWSAQVALEGDWSQVVYGNGKFVAVSRSSATGWNQTMSSSDGVTWTARALPSDGWKSLVYGSNKFVAVGNGKVITSVDGETWTAGVNIPNFDWTSVAYGNGVFVAGSYDRNNLSDKMMSSPDGQTWTERTAPILGNWNSIGYGDNRFVAVSDLSRIMTSLNGTTWTSVSGQPTDNGMSVNTSTWTSVTYGGGVFVAVASQGPRVMSSGSSVSITPATQTLNGTEGTAIAASTPFMPNGFAGTVTYAVSSGTLPAGLSIDTSTGVISGTPTAPSSAQITITGTEGTSTSTATVTFNIASAPPGVNLSPLNGVGNTSRTVTTGSPLNPAILVRSVGMTGPVTFTAVKQTGQATYEPFSLPAGLNLTSTGLTSAEITGTPTAAGIASFHIKATDGVSTVYSSTDIIVTVTAPTAPSAPNNSGLPAPPGDAVETPAATPAVGPTLITEERQTQLTSTAGGAKVLVGGQLVEVSLTQASSTLRSSNPSQRTARQVTELQGVASSMIEQLRAALGGSTGSLSVRNTSTGAVIIGLAVDPITGQPMEIPVENVVLVTGGGLVLMASGIDGQSAARIGLDGSIEIPKGGQVAVVAGGLTPGVNGEVVVMSTPRLIGDFKVGASGDIAEQATLPTDLSLGAHTVVVTVGAEAASLGFRVVDSGALPALPRTGRNSDLITVWSLVFLVGGALVLAIDRRKNLLFR